MLVVEYKVLKKKKIMTYIHTYTHTYIHNTHTYGNNCEWEEFLSPGGPVDWARASNLPYPAVASQADEHLTPNPL